MVDNRQRYKPYPEYKDSEVEWLGETPSGWDVTSVKYLADLTPKKPIKTKDLLSKECSFVPMEKLKLDKLELDVTKPIVEVFDGYTYFEDEDVLIAKVTPCFENKNMAVASNLVNGIGFGSSEIYVLRVRDNAYNRFLFYRLQENIFMSIVISNMTGAGGLRRVPADIINNYSIAIPAKSEQEKIANFLDYETAKIDTLIEKQQHLIELLTEKRQAVISHAVTKGLNPDVPMKDSGVEWLGEVPAHWEVSKLSFKLKLLSGDGITSNEIEPTGDYPVLGGNGLRGYTDKYNCNGDYVLIGRQGALCGNINLGHGKFFATEHAVVVYPHEKFDITFLSEFLRFMDLGQYSVSAAQPGISVDRINSLKIVIPPYQEQVKIGIYLRSLIETFETLSDKAKLQIQLLTERRTALISAAVTGKIDVRDWVKPE